MKTGLTRFSGLAVTLCVIAALHQTLQADASTYNVTNTHSSGAGSLSQAMSQAQSDTNAVINISPGLGAIALSSTLPAVQNNLVLNGNSNTISGAGSNRIFFVNAPAATVQINGLTLSNGMAQGGNGGVGFGSGGGGAGLGGAIFLNAGNLTVSNISFLNNSAHGGAGSVGFDAGLNPTLGGGGGGGGLNFNGGAGAGGTVDNKTYEGPAGGGGALTSAGATVTFRSTFGGTGGGANGGTGGSVGLGKTAGNGVSPSLPDGGGGGGGMSSGPGTGGNGGNGSDFGGGGGAGSSDNGNSGKSGNGGFGGGGGGGAFSLGGMAFPGGNGGFGGGGGGGGKGLISTNATNASFALGGAGGFGGGFGSTGTNGNGGGALGAGGAIFARAGATLAIQDSTFNEDTVTGGSATSPATNGSAIGQALFLGGNVNYIVSSGTNNLSETIGGGNDTNAEGSLTKSGAGTLALTAAESYTGATTVNAGTLEIMSNIVLQSPAITINSNAVLEYNYSTRILQPGTTYSGTGTLRVIGSGTPTFGTNPVTVSFSPGALIDIQSGQLTGSTSRSGIWTANQASMNIAGGAVFDAVDAGTSATMQIDALSGAGTFEGGYSGNPNGLSTVTIGAAGGGGNFSGTLKDDSNAHLGVVKTGTGTEIFSGIDTYSGATTINGGALVVSNTVLHSPAISIAAGAVLNYSEANGAVQPGTTYTGAGTLRFTGTGNLTFGSGRVGLGLSPGALIDIQSGEFTGSSGYNGYWISNQASMNITNGAVFDAMDAGPTGTMQLDALTGGGIFQGGNSSFTAVAAVTIGVAGGGGTFSGTIKDDIGGSVEIVKTGSGTEIFSGPNTYSGNTIVNAGILIINGTAGSGIVLVNGGALGGTGTISGAVSIGPGATLAPGAPTGTLTMLNTLTLAGNTLITLNAGAASSVAGLSGIDYSGTLTITNMGGPLSTGSAFKLFSAGSSSGNFSSIIGNPGAGQAFRFNPANGVLSVVSTTLPTTPTNLTFKASSTTLTVNWPASYTGWVLQAQTNPIWLGMTSSNWLDVTGSGSTDSMTFAISPTNNVFFRMRQP